MQLEKAMKCKVCGSDTFWLDESTGWKLVVHDDGSVSAKMSYNDFDSVSCMECKDTEHVQIGDYSNIEFK